MGNYFFNVKIFDWNYLHLTAETQETYFRNKLDFQTLPSSNLGVHLTGLDTGREMREKVNYSWQDEIYSEAALRAFCNDISSALLITIFTFFSECSKCRIRMDFILPAVVHLCPHLTPRLQACQMDPRVRTRPSLKISRIFDRQI